MTPDSHEQPLNAPLTRTEAIRRAIDVLGPHAQVPQILDYVWEKYGIGVPPSRTVASPDQTRSARSGVDKGTPQDRPVDSAPLALRETVEFERVEGAEPPLLFANPKSFVDSASEPNVAEARTTETDNTFAAPENPAPPKKPASKRTRPKE